MDTNLLTLSELAETLKVSTKTVNRMKKEGMPSVPITKGTERYRIDDVLQWCAKTVSTQKAAV